MKSKKLIGIVAVLALIAVVFAGSAAAVTTTDNAIYKMTDVNDNQIVKVASLTTMEPIEVNAIYARLTNLDSNALGAIGYRYAMLNTMDTNTNRAMLTNLGSRPFIILPATLANLSNLDTNQYGYLNLANLSRFADTNSATLNTMDTNTNRAMLNAIGTNSFIILPATLNHLNTVDTNQYGYLNLANLSRFTDTNSAMLNSSFAISVADLSRFALNSGNMSELMSFLNRLNDTNTNTANSTLRADLNALNTNLNTTANLNADTNRSSNLSESSGAFILHGERFLDRNAEIAAEFGKAYGSEAVASDTSSKNLSEASGSIINLPFDRKMDLDSIDVITDTRIRI